MLESQQLIFRIPEPKDIEQFYKWENDTVLWLVSNTIIPINKYTLHQFITSSHDLVKNKQLRLVICLKKDNTSIGLVDLYDYDPVNGKAGIGIMIDQSYRKQGYANETIQFISDYCRNILNLHQIYCNILSDNIPSIKLFESCGFQQTGIKKEWVKQGDKFFDEYIYQLIFK